MQFLMEGSNLLYVVAGLLVVILALLIITIYLLVKTGKLTAKYNAFMKGSDGATLEDSIRNRFKEIDVLKKETSLIAEKLDVTVENLLSAFQKIGVVKYDAFAEMGGKLSFSLCLLDDKNNGFILSSIHTREGCHSYIKEIIRGESFVIMSTEERKALEIAIKKTAYTDEK